MNPSSIKVRRKTAGRIAAIDHAIGESPGIAEILLCQILRDFMAGNLDALQDWAFGDTATVIRTVHRLADHWRAQDAADSASPDPRDITAHWTAGTAKGHPQRRETAPAMARRIPHRMHRKPAPPPDMENDAYISDMRSRLGELAQVARSAPDTSHACTTDEARAARLRFIDRLESAHNYLLGLSLQTRKEAA